MKTVRGYIVGQAPKTPAGEMQRKDDSTREILTYIADLRNDTSDIWRRIGELDTALMNAKEEISKLQELACIQGRTIRNLMPD